MRIIRQLLVGISFVALLAIAFPASAQADPFNEKTILTFSGPVGLPGISLPAGTYVFRLADPDGDRSVVQVFNREGTVCYGTFLTLPDTALKAVDRPAVTFEERASRAPEAVRTWFYPGNETGREFTYPERRSGH
jgi:hypothetical protein